jgi:magnesium-transporting ATPase (P-type)
MSDNTDPVVRTGRREALMVVGIWLTAAVWSLTVSYKYGYHQPIEKLKTIWGFPAWTFWGVVVPWIVCVVVSWIFGVMFVHDAHLGEELLEDADELGLGG